MREVATVEAPARDGRLLFARYAIAPNRLGYCGGPEDAELFAYCVADEADPGIDPLIRQFQAAYPYLGFIARASGIGDPFDARVVEAYWLGNALTRRVDAGGFHAFVEESVGRRVPPRLLRHLAGQVPAGARPHHSFHVLDVSTRAGALSDDIETLDRCRIAWGTVEAVHGERVRVRARPLVLAQGRFALGEPQQREARRAVEGRGYLDDLAPGATVTLHWDWVCDEVTPAAAAALEAETRRHLAIANTRL
jgi:hypothetical protein